MAKQRENRPGGKIGRRWMALGGLALLLLASTWSTAEIYKCRTADGRTEFTNAPCPSHSGTLSVYPDETVPIEAQEEARHDIERMRGFLDQRSVEQRQEAQRQAAEDQATAAQRAYAAETMDDCLAELSRQALPLERRAELEAICRAKTNLVPVMPPFYGIGNGFNPCLDPIMRQRLAPAEQQRRLSRCGGFLSPLRPAARPPAQQPGQAPRPSTPQPAHPCAGGGRYCGR